MAALHKTKCINHASREAAARCPACKNFFCRECITEHDGRLICTSCLQKIAAPEDQVSSGVFKRGMHLFRNSLKAGFSFLVLWIVFYAIGQFLLQIPDSFHSGELWGNL